MISVNQRIQSLEQELFIKRQELDGLRHQNETAIIKAQKDGIVQFPSILQQGDLINPGQEIVSIIPKEEQKSKNLITSSRDKRNKKRR